jgi:uncharacterized protein
MPMTAATEARSVVQSFYSNLAGGRPDALFALCSDDIEWNEAEINPLADRNPYRGVHQIAEGVFGRLGAIFVHSWWVKGGKIVRFQQYADTAQLARLS